MEDRFRLAVDLYKFLGETNLPTGNNLRTELRLDLDISLWDVVATYMVLYRFPLLFSCNGRNRPWHEKMKCYLRPYRGLGAQFRDSVVSPPYRTAMGCSKWPEGYRTVLFLGFVPTFYRDVLQPVAESHATNENIRVVVVSEGKNTLNFSEKIIFQSLWEHWNKDVEVLSKLMLRRLKILKNIFFSKQWLKSLMKNVRLSCDNSSLTREFYWLFWREFKRLIPQIAVARHILVTHRPSLIISADDADQRCRIYSLLARECGIPSLLVQQGLTSREYPEWAFFSHNIIAAMGETSRSAMIAQGIPDERIIVTGHPGFDRLLSQEPDTCVHVRAELGVKNAQKMVLFTSQPYYVGVFNTPEIRGVMIKAIVDAVNSLENMLLVIKPHPSDNTRELRKLIGKLPKVVIADRTANISHLIKSCDILITFFSTSALEALHVDKPVINVAFPGSGGSNMYIESGATWVARSQNEITTLLKILTGENSKEEITKRETNQQHFISKWAHLPDGHATERVVEVILGLMRNQKVN